MGVHGILTESHVFFGRVRHLVAESYCCKGQPENSICAPATVDRPGHLHGCERHLDCAPKKDKSGGKPIPDQFVCYFDEPTDWLIGMTIALIGAFMVSLGVNLQKYAFRCRETLPKEKQKSMARMPVRTCWIICLCKE